MCNTPNLKFRQAPTNHNSYKYPAEIAIENMEFRCSLSKTQSLFPKFGIWSIDASALRRVVVGRPS